MSERRRRRSRSRTRPDNGLRTSAISADRRRAAWSGALHGRLALSYSWAERTVL